MIHELLPNFTGALSSLFRQPSGVENQFGLLVFVALIMISVNPRSKQSMHKMFWRIKNKMTSHLSKRFK